MRRTMRLLPALAFAVIASTIPVFPAAAAAAGPRTQSQLDLPRSLLHHHVASPATRASTPPRLAPLAAPACSSTFNTVASPSPGSGDNILANNALLAFSATNVWAVGSTTNTAVNPAVSQTLIEHWDGTSWTQVSSPNVLLGGQPTDNALEGISGVSATDIWAAGAFYNASNAWQPLVVHYDGTSWTITQPSGVGSGDNVLYGVKAVSASNVWAVGYSRLNNTSAPAQTLALHYDGVSWSTVATQSIQPGASSNAFLAIAASANNDVWAVGRYVVSPGIRRTLIEHYDGISWSIVASPNASNGNNALYSVSTLGSTAWVVGYFYDPAAGKVRTLIEQWNGTNWSVVPSPNVGGAANPDNYLFSVTAISANNVWAVGDANAPTSSPTEIPATGITLAEHWNGSTWTAISSANSSSGFNEFNAVAATSPTTVWAVGDYFNGGSLDQTLAENFCLAAPAVTDVKPTLGNTLGGDRVAVIGDGVAFASGVSFGSIPATSFRVDSEHHLTAITPAEPEGVVDTRVTSDAGTSPVAIIDEFRFGPYASSTLQYGLASSDGVTWKDIDASSLVLSLTPAADSYAILSGNVDLWTANAGYNQDVGISVSGGTGTGQGVYPTLAGQPEAWKESGGFAGTYSPNAAFVQTVVFLKQGAAYTAKLQWKTNRAAPGVSIYAGAGPWPPPDPYQEFTPSGFSPTRLTAQLVPAASTNLKSVSIINQPVLSGSSGSSWVDMDPALSFTYTPTSDGNALISTNADLWTNTAKFNQDIGITVAGGSSPAYPSVAGQPELWKESGGFAGTFSPNAAYAHGVIPLKQGIPYTIKVQWKANRASPASAAIVAGAGPIAGKYSPTSLTLLFAPTPGPNGLYQLATTTQRQLSGPTSDGATFQEIDTSVTFGTGSNSDCVAILSGNADLWTANAGYNQDIAVELSGTIIGWKESGGFAGTFSPNAAFVQAPFAVTAMRTYTLTLTWKANKPAQNATIVAGAGPIGGRFSPTSLTLQTFGCS